MYERLEPQKLSNLLAQRELDYLKGVFSFLSAVMWLLGERACRGSGPLKASSITREKGTSRKQDAGLGGCGKHWGTQNSHSHGCHGEQAEHIAESRMP